MAGQTEVDEFSSSLFLFLFKSRDGGGGGEWKDKESFFSLVKKMIRNVSIGRGIIESSLEILFLLSSVEIDSLPSRIL